MILLMVNLNHAVNYLFKITDGTHIAAFIYLIYKFTPYTHTHTHKETLI